MQQLRLDVQAVSDIQYFGFAPARVRPFADQNPSWVTSKLGRP